MDGGKDDRFWEVLNSDIVKGDVVTEVMTKVVVDEGILSGGNWWTVLLLLKLGNGLVDKIKESFGGGEIKGQVLRLQWALIVQLVLRVDWWQVL